MGSKYLLEMNKIDKRFPGVHALKEISFTLKAGEVHALLGENGAGKSTLINVLGGAYYADGGEILIDGQKADIRSIRDSQERGIAVIHQELVLVPEMTIAENIFLGREPKTKAGMVNRKKMNSDAQEIIDSVGLHMTASRKIGRLSVAQQQMVEISKALSLNAKILVMDEPTSSLSDSEVDILFQTIRRLKGQNVGVIYVSHRMSELFDITDRITIMRDGAYIDTKNTADTNVDELVYLMVGRELENYYTRNPQEPGAVALEVRGLCRRDVLNHINFLVREGEILGFAGLIGAGRSELMRAIVGLDHFDEGQILLYGQEFRKLTCEQAQQNGLVMVPENRKLQGLVLKNTVSFNLTLTVLKEFIRGCLVNQKREGQLVEASMKSLRIKAFSPKQIIGTLSGGNQQKVLIGKWLAAKPKILIMDEPTRGVDVGAKADIYAIIDQLASTGIAIIMVSSELNEVINMCDRVLVMAGGEITGELHRGEFTQEKMMQYATKTRGGESDG